MRHSLFLLLALLSGCLSFASRAAAPDTNDIVFADFEGTNYGSWSATGNAWGLRPARGAWPQQQPVTGYLGAGLLNSFGAGDAATGTLTSSEFKIARPYINFLIGGGNHPGETCLNLVVDGVVVRTSTGHDAERLVWNTWQIFEFVGKTGHLEIIDRHMGAWGHINLDQITFSQHHKVHAAPNDAIARAMNFVTEAMPRAERNPSRPRYHFLAPAQWMNDPNGPIFHRGYYHIFYQHNPFGDAWGHMHWGHARSRDLVTWKHLSIALWPSKELGEDHVFSGSATLNGRGEPMAFYTSIGRGKSATDYAEQWAAVSDPDLYQWTKLTNNPVLSEKLHGATKIYDWRDPYFFKAEGRSYIVTGGNLNRGKGGQAIVSLYEAENDALTRWKYRGILFTHPDPTVPNIECPNFFRLGDQWVLLVSPHGRVQYFVGSFDPAAGKFHSQHRGLLDLGDDYYAPTGLTDATGRHVLFGWVRGFKAGQGWNGCLSLPRVLTLSAAGELLEQPVPALQKLRGPPISAPRMSVENSTNSLGGPTGDTLEIEAEIEPGPGSCGLLLTSPDAAAAATTAIRFDGSHLSVAEARGDFKLAPGERVLRLHVFVDRSVIEVYANDRAALTKVVTGGASKQGVAFFSAGGAATLKSAQAWTLKTIWDNP